MNAAVTGIVLSRKIHLEGRYKKVVCISFYCISFLYSSVMIYCYSACSIHGFCIGLYSLYCLVVLWLVTAERRAGCVGWALPVPLRSQHPSANRGALLKASGETSLCCTCCLVHLVIVPIPLPFHPPLKDTRTGTLKGSRKQQK